MSSDSIRIKKNTLLGSLEAESDSEMLSQCFIDNGDLEALLDCQNSASVILGRTGVGKTALIIQILEKSDHVVKIDPSEIAFKYIENSKVIQFLEDIDVNLDLFYKLLWRHVLTVELLKLRYEWSASKNMFSSWWNSLTTIRVNPAKKIAIEYLKNWGDEFWQRTDSPIKEITNKFAEDIEAGLASKFQFIDINTKAAKSLSTEEKYEIVERAKDVVNSLQIQELSSVIKYLSEDVFNDSQKKYLILIDQLDENWSDEKTRFKLIKALIEEIKSFRKIKQIKIIIAMRDDLLQQVMDHSMGHGFQPEKFDSYLLLVRWSDKSLQDLVDTRVRNVFERKYTKQNVSFLDVFPKSRGRGEVSAFQYMLERTFRRPRDILHFSNICFKNAVDASGISWSVIQSSEIEYSISKKDNLIVEWQGVYPSLKYIMRLLIDQKSSMDRFELLNSTDKKLDIYTAIYESGQFDSIYKSIREYFDDGSSSSTLKEEAILDEIILCLYRVGVIGVKKGTEDRFLWSFRDRPMLDKFEASSIKKIRVHKMFWKSLSIKDTSESRGS